MPSACSAAARLAVTVDLPTPPLPEPTQITFFTRASAPCGSAPAAEALLERLLLGVAEHVEVDTRPRSTPSSAPTLLGDGLLEVRADRAAGVVSETRHVHAAVVARDDRADHAQLDDVLAQLGVDDAA